MTNAEPVADIDLAIDKVLMFRLEQMNDGAIWIRLYREGGEDKVIWLDSASAISTIVEDDKAEAALAQSDAEPLASEIEQLKAKLHNTWQRLETTQASEEGWKKRCQFVEAERDEARASRPDASAKDVATKIASRPALAKLIDAGALQFSELCDLRDDIETALCSRPDASAGLIEAAPNDVVTALLAERERQKSVEGWTPEHDDTHENGELALAAGCYALQGSGSHRILMKGDSERCPSWQVPFNWPWSRQAWKPTDRYRDLVKAGALILAELERLARARAADRCEHQWIDARNEHVKSGEVCLKCGAIRAADRSRK